jgi:hypothetical protein
METTRRGFLKAVSAAIVGAAMGAQIVKAGPHSMIYLAPADVVSWDTQPWSTIDEATLRYIKDNPRIIDNIFASDPLVTHFRGIKYEGALIVSDPYLPGSSI